MLIWSTPNFSKISLQNPGCENRLEPLRTPPTTRGPRRTGQAPPDSGNLDKKLVGSDLTIFNHDFCVLFFSKISHRGKSYFSKVQNVQLQSWFPACVRRLKPTFRQLNNTGVWCYSGLLPVASPTCHCERNLRGKKELHTLLLFHIKFYIF